MSCRYTGMGKESVVNKISLKYLSSRWHRSETKAECRITLSNFMKQPDGI